MTTPTTAENRDDRIEAVSDMVEVSRRIAEALSCAESCETDADLDANIDDVIDAAVELLKLARGARS